ncbi:hypothetical protein LTR91_006112 [Friedmanniomyces endolithicus]|uniref:Major facilitator superfamily (MFS) profile domain-containing protein n=1 Tax=Friedmanniomyces endolithicus TaxID=329885 RepID=A0AAN6KU86_9PEZI|nr:hypothetical protein LTR35_009884 [Friedmanniomyces endolithicus]KAK0283214.1 hypothetical protein LTS00_011818 [Friedmanniomyces endolithicus]KAK0320030.1 hypothetical protein LTR82_008965 [Friedmanniomyces endolithicus]KAK0923835.1 hypothetical protein LTR57_006495 [Friedmanniomyces endolithicus]KAK0999315.1 hypothetical protein LTR91_006112 [Friedmanniomyces endolithicus]
MIKLNLFGRGLKLQIAIMVGCQMAFILFGYDQGVFGGIVTNEDWLNTFGHPGSGLEGIIVSIYNLGAFSGCILTFIWGEKLGRRLCMWLAMGWIITGAILQCTSYSVPQIMVARYITGIGTGIETSTVPMYQSELCDADKRGRLVSSEPLFVGVGIVISYFFDYGMRFVGGPVAWRVPIACQVIFAFVVIFLVFGLPESPRWLYYHGRNDEALQVMCDVWDEPPEGEKVLKMQTEILETIAMERKEGEYKWANILKRDDVQTGRRVLLAYGMQFMNQVGGINLVVYYVPTALQNNVGLSANLSLVIGGCVQTMFFFGSLIPTFLLDRMGRRRPMMWGSAGLAISMMLIAVLLSFSTARGYSPTLQKATSSASVTFFFTYMFIFGATANCIPWVYVPEILPLHARAKGTAIGISSNWLWKCVFNHIHWFGIFELTLADSFVIVMITPTLLNNLQWKGYLYVLPQHPSTLIGLKLTVHLLQSIFMCTNFAFVPLVYFCYPETKNLTLEEVDHLFTAGGKHGAKALTAPSQPVQESFRAQALGDDEKLGGRDGGLAAEHAEVMDEVKDSHSV